MDKNPDSEIQKLNEEFDKIVKQIFRLQNFAVIEQEDLTDKGFDFRIKYKEIDVLVEVKLYRTDVPKKDLIEKACLSFPVPRNNEKRVLVVPCYIPYHYATEILEVYGVILLGVDYLRGVSSEGSEIIDLHNLLGRIHGKTPGILPYEFLRSSAQWLKDDFGKKLDMPAKEPKITKPQKTDGKRLCEELKAIKAGKAEAAAFEEKCEQILKHLFDNDFDLELWARQKGTEDGLNRYDLLCRIITGQKNTFWTELSHDFRCRYIVFEFKNYSKAIKQTQIYTTEKYLFVTALRSVSFIIAKNDADANAKKAAKGALKEAGKLIVILTADDLCDMLDAKEKGNEPSDILKDRIDNMLIELAR